jgi:thymidylate synthase
VPFNIASYALLTAMVAQAVGLRPGELIHSLGDVHLYLDHLDVARAQLERAPRPAPRLWLDPAIDDLFAFEPEHIRFDGYDPHPPLRARVSA